MKKRPGGYYVNRHSCFLLQYHLVLVTKYRHPVICGEVEEFLKEYTADYMKKQGLHLLAVDCMPDHMHILFEATPQTDLAKLINAFKSASSRVIRNRFAEELIPYYRKPYFWSLSYFIGTVSERTTGIVETYIRNQKNNPHSPTSD